jgi:hypothetical protein
MKEPLYENQTECQEIEPKSVEGYSYAWWTQSFILNWIYNIYFLLVSSNYIRILKQVPKYLATGL